MKFLCLSEPDMGLKWLRSTKAKLSFPDEERSTEFPFGELQGPCCDGELILA